MPTITRNEPLFSQLRLTLASKWRPVPNGLHLAFLISIYVALAICPFSPVAAHPPGNYPDNFPSATPSVANTPLPSSGSSSSSSATGSVTFNNVDETRLQEILTNLYTHMKKYEQNSPSPLSSSSLSSSSLSTASLPTTDPNALNQEHLITERVKEFLNNMEQQQQTNKQENLKVNFAANGKTMGTEEGSQNINMKSLTNNVQVNEQQQQQLQLQQQQQQQPQQIATSASASHYQMPLIETVAVATGVSGTVPTASQKLVKLDTYSTMTEKRSAESGEPLKDVPVVTSGQQTNVNANKYSLSSLGTSALQRPKVSLGSGEQASKAAVASSTAANSMGVVVGVQPSPASSMPIISSNPSHQQQLTVDSSSLYELLASIDSRVQKLQDSLVYYRNTPKPVHSAVSQLNPIFTNYLSLIKAQVLNIESTIEAKFSNMEHKYSNMEIEDGIWKKTINWKLEEMASKLSQNENKLSFSNDQIMNKMDLFERNFQIVTNDFFSKFLLVNEKLNKIELSLQTKWNDLEVKLRNNFVADGYNRQSQKMSSFFKPDLVESAHADQGFKEHNALPSVEQQITKASATATPAATPAPAPALAPVSTPNEQFVVKKPVEQIKENIPGIGSKLNWNKSSLIKPANVTNLSDRLKFAQRFLKLMNSKTNQTVYNRKPYNSTFLLESLSAQASGLPTSGPNALMSDAPAVPESAIEMSGSPVNVQRPTAFEQANSNSSGKLNKTQLHQQSPSSQLPTQNYRLTGAAVSNIASGTAPNVNASQAVANNRNIDSIDGITFAEFINKNSGNISSLRDLAISRSRPEMTEPNLNSNQCLHLRSVLNYMSKEEEANFFSMCNQMMNRTAFLEMYPVSETQHNENQIFGSREALLEKRELSEEILVDSVKEAPSQVDRPNPVEETLNQLNEIKTDKLEELDSKLQFFSTKIINIVQEMWLSSQASENYLKESLALANKTKIMMKEEFTKLQQSVKPIQQLTNLAEEIREPIVNRLTELTTALNNSMEVILNTQAGFINSCRFIRDEDIQLFEVLDYFVNETALQRNQQQTQFAQFNKSFEFLLVKLDAVNRKTIEGVRSETMKVLEHIKSELHHQMITIASGANRAQSLLAAGAEHMSRAGADSLPNECFITKKEFATFCVDDKMFSTVMDAANGQNALHSLDKDIGANSELEIQYGNGTRGATGIEINNGNEN